MKIHEFRKLKYTDHHKLEVYGDGYCWSRIYEYPFVLNSIEKYNKKGEKALIHNTSWGWKGVHVIFKDHLQKLYSHTVHSDIKDSNYSNTIVYDITQPTPEDHKNKYDFVINVSTVEELKSNHIETIKNLLNQIIEGGFLILTFDIPGADINALEKFVGKKIQDYGEDNLDCLNSSLPNQHPVVQNLNCGVLILEKNIDEN